MNDQSSIIAESLVLSGEVEGSGSLRIFGTVRGRIRLDGDCHVEKLGRIDGDVEAENVFLAGHVEGNLTALKSIEIHGTGNVEGDIRVPKIVISVGASINGQVQVGEI